VYSNDKKSIITVGVGGGQLQVNELNLATGKWFTRIVNRLFSLLVMKSADWSTFPPPPRFARAFVTYVPFTRFRWVPSQAFFPGGPAPQTPRGSLRSGLRMSLVLASSWSVRMAFFPGLLAPQIPRGSLRSGLRMSLVLASAGSVRKLF
jgi:hypothetical protein